MLRDWYRTSMYNNGLSSIGMGKKIWGFVRYGFISSSAFWSLSHLKAIAFLIKLEKGLHLLNRFEMNFYI